MRVLITVSFKAPLGGLQSHVGAQARAIREAGGDAVVHCPDGPFADSLRRDGFAVLVDKGENPDREAARLRSWAGSIDIVHAHPFRSRMIAERVAATLGKPLALTLHSQYLDGLEQKHENFSLIVAVSNACRDFVIKQTACRPEKVVVLHNGVDLAHFSPGPPTGLPPVLREIVSRRQTAAGGKPIAALVTRLDADKNFLLDLVADYWTDPRARVFHWVVAGDGTQRDQLKDLAARCLSGAEGPAFHFAGWQAEEGLRDIYRMADFVVAPGRCALEALACGRPVLAMGSKGYVGPVPGYGALRGLYSNFGGWSEGEEQVSGSARFAKDVARLHETSREGASSAEACRSFVSAHFDQASIDRGLVAAYRSLC